MADGHQSFVEGEREEDSGRAIARTGIEEKEYVERSQDIGDRKQDRR
jgi:hypothetical protein